MKRLAAAFAWFFLSAGVILTSIGVAQGWSVLRPLIARQSAPAPEMPKAVIAAQTPPKTDYKPNGSVQGAETIIETQDARPRIVANFLERHGSPMQPYAEYGQFLVGLADQYNFDFRLLPAISMQESNLCKQIPEGSYNCLGFGIHSRGTLTFDSYKSNFARAAKELRANYISEGRVTPEMIMKKYTPHSDGSWAASVNQWMAEMRYDDYQTGKELKTPGANVLEFANPTPSP